jgi:hypothetical protein
MSADRKCDLTDIRPVAGSDGGWSYKKFKCVGSAEIPRSDGTVDLYGVYGVRGDEVFAQYRGRIDADGAEWGVSLLSSSADLETYFWLAADHFPVMSINGVNVVREVTDER